jgi:hypothetical protein
MYIINKRYLGQKIKFRNKIYVLSNDLDFEFRRELYNKFSRFIFRIDAEEICKNIIDKMNELIEENKSDIKITEEIFITSTPEVLKKKRSYTKKKKNSDNND